MGFDTLALGGNPGNTSGLSINRTLIPGGAQTTPTSIKLGQGNLYGVYAIASGTAAAFVQYFTHGGTTMGTSLPHFEVVCSQQVTVSGIGTANVGQWHAGGLPIPFNGTATTSGIWVGAHAGMGTGSATTLVAGTITVYSLYA